MTEPLRLNPDAESWKDLLPGEFCYRMDGDRPKWLIFWPQESATPLMAAIAPLQDIAGASWALSGSIERPTLDPSVNAAGIWHGWLRDGVATAC